MRVVHPSQSARRRRWSMVVPLAALLAAALAAVAPAPAAAVVPKGKIAGTITMNGCQPAPADIRLTASPAKAVLPKGDTAFALPGMRAARVSATADPHVFTFKVSRLYKKKMYRLGIRVLSGACTDRVVWEGPAQGLAMANGRPLKITGSAIRTRVEVLRQPAPSGLQPAFLPWEAGADLAAQRLSAQFVGADFIDLSASTPPEFRVSSDVPGATHVVVELSSNPPAMTAAADIVHPPAGTFYQQTFPLPVAGGWSGTIPLDVTAAVVAAGGDSPPPPGAQPGNRPIGMSSLDFDMIGKGAPLFVRVIAARMEGSTVVPIHRSTAGESGAVILVGRTDTAYTPPPPPWRNNISVERVTYEWPEMPQADFSNMAGCYKTIKDHVLPHTCGTRVCNGDESSCWYEYVSCNEARQEISDELGQLLLARVGGWEPGAVVPAGSFFCIPKPPAASGLDAFLNSAVDYVTGLVDAIGSLVTKISELYAQAKELAISAVASALESTGLVNCDPGSYCRNSLTAALDAGLAALGMPPSLPNWDQLVDQGIDALAAYVAEQTSVPAEWVDWAATKALEVTNAAVHTVKEERGLPGADWAVFEDGVRWPLMTVTVWQNSPFTTKGHFLRMDENQYFVGVANIPLSDRFLGRMYSFTTQLMPKRAPVSLYSPDPLTKLQENRAWYNITRGWIEKQPCVPFRLFKDPGNLASYQEVMNLAAPADRNWDYFGHMFDSLCP